MRARGSGAPAAAAIMAAALLAMLGATSGSAATSPSTISASVPSATTLDRSACADGVAGVTDFGLLVAASATVSSSDCTLTFGSSNDSAMLRIAQADGGGAALWRPAHGPVDTSFDGDGLAVADFGAGEGGMRGSVQADDRIIVTGGSGGGLAAARFLPSGVLDTSFDGDGKAVAAGFPWTVGGWDVAVAPDGKVVLAGHRNDGSFSTIAVARLTASGALDTSFDGDGRVTTAFGGDDYGHGVTVQRDGKPIVCGTATPGYEQAVARYNVDGSLDTSFSGDGKVLTNIASGFSDCFSVHQLPDGKILAAGSASDGDWDFAATRYLADGTLDTTFDGDGIAVIQDPGGPDQAGYDAALQSDGKLVMVGTAQPGATADVSVARFTTSGAADTTFGGGDGVLTFDVAGGADRGYGIGIAADGGIYVSGRGFASGTDRFMVARVTSAGELDSSFGTGGIRTYNLGSADSNSWDIEMDDDGRVFATGHANNGTDNDMAVLRLDSERVADHADGVTDWDQGANSFGACLRSVGGGASTTWTVSATCPASDGAFWNAIPATPMKIAFTSSAGTSATAALRFGFRTATAQAAGAYVAPTKFEVLAPDA